MYLITSINIENNVKICYNDSRHRLEMILLRSLLNIIKYGK